MFKDKLGGQYSKFLTILLIIAIILIVGLLGFLGYDIIRKYYVTKEADAALNEFDKTIVNNTKTNMVVSNEVTNVPTTNTDTNITIPTTNTVSNVVTGGNTGSSNTGSSNNSKKPYYTVGKIEIPKTDCEYPIYSKATRDSIEKGVAILHTTGGLNQVGNTVIEGHNYRNGLFFSNNKKLEAGDKVYITDESGNKVTYTIYNKYETTPEDASYLERDTDGKREIVLLTCTDYTNQRIVIFASAD